MFVLQIKSISYSVEIMFDLKTFYLDIFYLSLVCKSGGRYSKKLEVLKDN